MNSLTLLDLWKTSMSYWIAVRSEHTAEVSSAFSAFRSLTCIHLRLVAVEVFSGFFLQGRQHAPSVCTAFCFHLHFNSTAINLGKQLTVLCRQTPSFMNRSTTTCFHKSSLHLYRLCFRVLRLCFHIVSRKKFLWIFQEFIILITFLIAQSTVTSTNNATCNTAATPFYPWVRQISLILQ